MTRTQSFLMGAAGALALLVVVVGVGYAADIFTVDKDGTVRLVITDAGNVGIGTTPSGFKLEVAGSTKLIKAAAPLVKYNDTSLDRGWTGYASWLGGVGIYNDQGGGSLVVQDTSGNVGVGTTDPKTKLHVTGLPEYADNAAALAAGLTAGAFYRTGDVLKVVH